MANVGELLGVKMLKLLSISEEDTALDAAQRMNEHKVGSLVVLKGDRLIGIVTERDILQRVVAQRREPSTTKVGQIMTAEVVYCEMGTALEEARGVMKNRRIRHLPVLDKDGQIRGIISIGDLNAQDATIQEQTIHQLKNYIYGQT